MFLKEALSKKQSKVFIAHGRNENILKKLETFLTENSIEPIVLRKTTSNGRSIFDNLDHHSNVKVAIVIYTPDDVGGLDEREDGKGKIDVTPRARQNVVFEHGYLLGKLDNVIMILDNTTDMELPTDISGLTYITTINEGEKAGYWK